MNLTISNSQIPLNKQNKIKGNKAQRASFVQFGAVQKTTSHPNLTQSYIMPNINAYSLAEKFEIPNIATAFTYKLSNGHQLTIVPKKGMFEMSTFVETDFQEDTTTSHFVEHLLSNSNNSFKNSTFKKELDKIGATQQATTFSNGVNYQISYPFNDKKDIETILQLQAQILQKPQFNDKKFNLEKGVLISEYALEDTSSRQCREEKINLKKRVINALFGVNLPVAKQPDKTQRLKNISINEIEDFYNKHYKNNNMHTVIVGDVEPEETAKIFARYFNKQNNNSTMSKRANLSTTPAQKAQRLDLKFQCNKENIAQINFPAFNSSSNKELAIFKLLSELAKTRKAGFDFSLIDASDYGIEQTTITVEQEMATNNATDSLNNLQQSLINFLTTPIAQQELEILKKRRKTNVLLASENNSLIALNLNEKNPKNSYLTQEQQFLKDVKVEDINNFISNYLKLDKALYLTAANTSSVSFLGSKNNFKINAEEYVYPNNLQLIVNSDNENKLASYCLDFQSEGLKKLKPATLEILLCMLQIAVQNNLPEEITFEPEITLSDNSLNVSGFSNPEDVLKLINLINKTVQYQEYSQEFFESIKQFLKEKTKDDVFLSKLTMLEFGENPNVAQLEKIATKEEKIKAINDVELKDVLGLLNEITKNSLAKATLVLPKNIFENDKNNIFNSINKGFNWKFQPKNNADVKNSFMPRANNSPISNVLINLKDSDSANICFSFKITDCQSEKEAMLADMLSIVLNNRIMESIREKYGLGYQMGATYEQNNGINYIKLQCTYKDGKENCGELKKIIQEIQQIVKELLVNGISNEELEALKLDYKKYWLENSYTTMGKAGLLSNYSIQENNQKYDLINSITRQEILQSAEKHLAKKPTIIIEANRDVLNSNNGYIATLGHLI